MSALFYYLYDLITYVFMKSLYKFITEGVLSDIDDTLSNGTTYVDVESWLNEHYNINGTYDINVLKK